jgi:rhamnose transport system permease protein
MTSLAYAGPRDSVGNSAPGFFSRHLREVSVAVAYGLLLAALALRQAGFFKGQFFATWVSAAPVLVAAVGMTLVILARHIDISIGSQFAVCAVLSGLLAKAGLPMPAVVVATVLAGAMLGAINGAFVAGMGLPSIVVTLATMVIYRESLRWARQGQFVRDLPAGFQWFGLAQQAGQWAVLLGALFVLGVFAWGMRWLAAGRAVYAVGSDREAARLAGIRPARVVFAVFVLMGALVGLAAMLNAVRFADVDPNVGTGWELQVIAAVVVGGAAISGGRGTLVGTLIGVALLATIGPALVFLKVPSQWEKAIAGVIILVAVASDGLYRRAR